MPEFFEIGSASGAYRVTIGAGLLNDELAFEESSIVLVDERLRGTLPAKAVNIVPIGAREENKSLEKIAPVIGSLRESGANRKSHIVAVGGGIIQDIATFVASIYMRGVPWRYFPTTLLGMVDSCIGGKSSINVLGYKNLVGNFYPPSEIFVDLNFIGTLNSEQMAAGLCEAAKICYAHSDAQFSGYLDDMPTVDMSIGRAERIVVRSLRCKQWFIEKDEYDQNERLLLNFGHTFGHAIEAVTDFAVSHGVGVGVGMIVADEYSHANGLLNERGKVRTAVLINHVLSLLSVVPTLSRELAKIDVNSLVAKFESDKKHVSDQYRVVLPTKDGQLELVGVAKNSASKSEISAAFSRGMARVTQ